jgi:hypothetical protein
VPPQVRNDGPSLMPYAFTQVTVVKPKPGPSALMVDNTVTFRDPRLAGGRVYLLQGGANRVMDLGRAGTAGAGARGAREGDRLCIFGETAFACITLNNAQPSQIQTAYALWQPELSMTPVNTTTLRLRLSEAPAGAYTAFVYPNGANGFDVSLTVGVEQTVTLPSPATEVIVTLGGSSPDQQLVTSYAAGSGPVRARSHDGPARARSHDGPFTNIDGTVIVYPPRALPADAFLAVQTAHKLPAAPPGRMLIGRGYALRSSMPALDYSGGSITFQYSGMDLVLANQRETNLAVYHWTGAAWQRLATVVNERQNIASAPLVASGIYALMAGEEVAICCLGWNLISYPIHETRPVTVALASLSGAYSMVYGYQPEDAADPWKLHAVSAPSWVNDLRQMEEGRGYWIYATAVMTWYIADKPLGAGRAVGSDPMQYPAPPATFYGKIFGGKDFVPAPGQGVLALVDGTVCGQGVTHAEAGAGAGAQAIVYVVDVWSVAADKPGCGAEGRTVTLLVEGVPMLAGAPWRSDAPTEADLVPLADLVHQQYLPAIGR